jgi:hypothetical protein
VRHSTNPLEEDEIDWQSRPIAGPSPLCIEKPRLRTSQPNGRSSFGVLARQSSRTMVDDDLRRKPTHAMGFDWSLWPYLTGYRTILRRETVLLTSSTVRSSGRDRPSLSWSFSVWGAATTLSSSRCVRLIWRIWPYWSDATAASFNKSVLSSSSLILRNNNTRCRSKNVMNPF